MSPEKLIALLTNLDAAADVVDAIDDCGLQRLRGWDLAHWRYDLVPWGVRFVCHDPYRPAPAEVVAVLPAGFAAGSAAPAARVVLMA
jgi:hypothetical protein